jgi:AcrR family transcriptional regulator
MNNGPRDTSGLSLEEQKGVLSAAMDLLGREGMNASFVDKLVDKSRISAARIFMHFGGPERMIQKLLERQLEVIAGSVAVPELRFPGETLRDELQVLVRIILEQCRNHIGLLRAVMGEAIRNPQFATVFYRTFILQGRKLFTEFLETRKSQGELREEIDVEAAAAFFLSSVIFSLLALELFGGKSVETIDDERLIRNMSMLFLTGIAPVQTPPAPRAAEKSGEKP